MEKKKKNKEKDAEQENIILLRHPVSICEFGCKHTGIGCSVQDERPCVFTYIHNTYILRNEVIKFKNRGAHFKWAAFGLPPLNYASG